MSMNLLLKAIKEPWLSSFEEFFSGGRCRPEPAVVRWLPCVSRLPDIQHSCEKFHSTPMSSLCAVHGAICL